MRTTLGRVEKLTSARIKVAQKGAPLDSVKLAAALTPGPTVAKLLSTLGAPKEALKDGAFVGKVRALLSTESGVVNHREALLVESLAEANTKTGAALKALGEGKATQTQMLQAMSGPLELLTLDDELRQTSLPLLSTKDREALIESFHTDFAVEKETVRQEVRQYLSGNTTLGPNVGASIRYTQGHTLLQAVGLYLEENRKREDDSRGWTIDCWSMIEGEKTGLGLIEAAVRKVSKLEAPDLHTVSDTLRPAIESAAQEPMFTVARAFVQHLKTTLDAVSWNPTA